MATHPSIGRMSVSARAAVSDRVAVSHQVIRSWTKRKGGRRLRNCDIERLPKEEFFEKKNGECHREGDWLLKMEAVLRVNYMSVGVRI